MLQCCQMLFIYLCFLGIMKYNLFCRLKPENHDKSFQLDELEVSVLIEVTTLPSAGGLCQLLK